MNSCTKNNDVHGVWISVSAFNEGEKPSTMYGQKLFDFQSDSVVIVQLGNPASGAYSEINIKKWPYEIRDNQILIYFDIDTSVFSYMIQDSLILSDQKVEGDFKKSFVFKRLDLSRNFSQSLKGNYTYNWPEDSDTICFINDSLCIGLGGSRMVKWRVFNYRGANLFMYEDNFWPTAAIWNNHPDTLHLSYHIHPKRKFTLVKSHNKVNSVVLLGEWTKFRNEKRYPPPPPPQGSGFMALRMSIEPDSLYIHYQNGTRTDHWKLTEDGNYIYFPNHLMSGEGFWKIIHASKDSLVFKTRQDRKVKWHGNS